MVLRTLYRIRNFDLLHVDIHYVDCIEGLGVSLNHIPCQAGKLECLDGEFYDDGSNDPLYLSYGTE